MLLNFAEINLSSHGDYYKTLYSHIKSAIENDLIKPGEKLPSIRESAGQLGVSRTTVENAYTRLCIEGYAESRPQCGYFAVKPTQKFSIQKETAKENAPEILYNFSSRKTDENASDTDMWKKTVRSVLINSGDLISYGDRQGEPGLRNAIADYSFKARGVLALAENIVIGAGVGPLLNILCGLTGRNVTVGFENGGFFEAEHIFSDYGIKTFQIASDKDGAEMASLKDSNADILFLMPSALPKISPTTLSNRRNEFCEWVEEKDTRLIIEDDYNGELRYTARSVSAFQRKAPQKTVYIGSFSKLLLPSVRIAYMVLPDFLIERFKNLAVCYNQTCGKIEQLALEKYIKSGNLEKHLRRLRRLYYNKSQLLCREIESNIECLKAVTLFESSLTLEIETTVNAESSRICKKALESGVLISESKKRGAFKLSFGGIAEEDICKAVKKINKILANL